MITRAISVLAVLVWTASYASAAERPTPAQLSAFFADVAFGTEYLKSGTPVIQKWREPVRIRVSEIEGTLVDKTGGGKELKLRKLKPKPEHIALLRKHLTTLVKLTGIKSESAGAVGKPPNFFIQFVPRLAMHAPFLVKGADPNLLKKLAAPGVCYFLTAAKKGEIIWATIVVNNQLDAKAMDACLLEEITQALGLPNDSDKVTPSVFNNRATPTALNRTDVILIKTLYDLRLASGMNKKQAMRRVPKIIAELDKKLP